MNALIEHFHFLRPLWLLALLLLPLLPWIWKRRTSANDPWRAAVDPALLPHLMQKTGSTASSKLPIILFGAGWFIAAAALAGPAFRMEPVPLVRLDSALIVALDLSDRMRSPDLPPDRATRAKIKLSALLAARGDGQTALIAWAGDAHTVAPLSDDSGSLRDMVSAMSPGVVPLGGQRPERAIALAQKLLTDAGFAQGDLLLITDQASDRAISAAAAAHASGLRVSVLGVGTTDGAPIPKPDGGFLPDNRGGILLPKLDVDGLQRLATAGGGHYATLSADNSDLSTVLPQMDLGSELRENARDGEQKFRDEGPWLALALLPLAALAFRRGWLMVLALVFALPIENAHALDWDSLWKRDDQRAHEALQQNDAAKARSLAQDPALRASAAYREGDFDAALRDFSAGDDADAHYNQGNALAKSGKLEEALSAYDEALKQAPDMQDAIENRKIVEDALKQQQQQQSGDQKNSQQGDKGEKGDQQKPQDQESSDSQQDQDGEPQQGAQQDGDQSASKNDEPGEPSEEEGSQQPQPSDQQQTGEDFQKQMEQALQEEAAQEGEETQEPPTAEAIREAEARQALEQALRRVPDDPGGLLRRKFQLEYQQRQRENQR